MKAGRELDALVAQKVMEWKWMNLPGLREPTMVPRTQWERYIPESIPKMELTVAPDYNTPDIVPAYSTDIAAAWLVMDKLLTMNIGVDVSRMPNNEAWHSALYLKDEDGDYMASADTMFEASSVPLAICLAALQALTHAPAEGG